MAGIVAGADDDPGGAFKRILEQYHQRPHGSGIEHGDEAMSGAADVAIDPIGAADAVEVSAASAGERYGVFVRFHLNEHAAVIAGACAAVFVANWRKNFIKIEGNSWSRAILHQSA